MVMVMRVAGTMVSGWSVFGLGSSSPDKASSSASPSTASVYAETPATAASAATATASRARALQSASQPVEVVTTGGNSTSPGQASGRRTVVTHEQTQTSTNLPPLARQRARGIGSRFRTAPTPQIRQVSR